MIRSYLKYLWNRKNEYHIHSPFVYEFYMRYVKGGDVEVLKRLGVLRVRELPVERLLEEYLSDLSEGVMFVARDIHKGVCQEAAWNAICRHPEVVLTMDFYAYGYVLYREGMEKQNFELRI